MKNYYVGDRAKNYEEHRSSEPKWHFEGNVLRAVLAQIEDNVRSIIDAPVGSGRFLTTYRSPTRGYDISEDMLAIARSKNTSAKLENFDFVDNELPAIADLVVSFRFLNLVGTPDAIKALDHLLYAAKRYALFTLRVVPDDYTGPMHLGRVSVHKKGLMEKVIEENGFDITKRYPYEDDVLGVYTIYYCTRQGRRKRRA